MAGQIDDLTFITLRGRPMAPALWVEAMDRAGQDGSEFRDLGLRERMTTLVSTTTALDASTAQAAAVAQRDKQGLIVSIIDSHGTTHTNCLILAVNPLVRTVYSPAVNPAHTRLILTHWTVRKLHVVT